MTIMRKRLGILAMTLLLFALVWPGAEAKQLGGAEAGDLWNAAPEDSLPGVLSFGDAVYLSRKEEDGTYAVTVSFGVDADICSDNGLAVSAYCAGRVQSVWLEGMGTYQFTFRGLPERPEVKLVAESFERSGELRVCDTAPPVLVHKEKVLTGYGELVMTPDRIVDIYKFEGESTPLPGVTFKIYLVAPLHELETEDPVFSGKPAQKDLRKYCVPGNLVTTLTTDADGLATFNFTEEGCPDGVYLVVQLPDITGEAPEPFFLQVPGVSAGGVDKIYTVTVNSGKTLDSAPEIAENILDPYGEDASTDVFRSHIRVIRVSVPIGLEGARKFTVSETLPPQLTYTRGSPVVKLLTRSGEERQLMWNTHFFLSEGSFFEEGEAKDHFVISLTQKGMSLVASSLGEGDVTPELRIYYDAWLDEDAVPGVYVRSLAKVDYMDRYGRSFSAEAESFGVCTGALRLHMTDMDGVPLAGGRFRIARAAAEAAAGPGTKVEKISIDGKLLDVVFISFVPGDDLSAPMVDTVTTDENGDASFCGLAHGTYYIVETVSPSGHDRMTEPMEVKVDDLSHRTDEGLDAAIPVVSPSFFLPETGEDRASFFTALGLSIACGASLMLLVDHRRGRI